MLILLLAAVYSSEACGVSFEYPDAWTIVDARGRALHRLLPRRARHDLVAPPADTPRSSKRATISVSGRWSR